jgi:HSP20 family protein
MSVLTSFDPFFRDLERLTESVTARKRVIPADAYRSGDEFVVHFDVPGIEPDSVEVTVEKNVLSVTAEREWRPEASDQVVLAERPFGKFSRQLYLSDNLNTDRIEAHYDRGVLTLRIPVSERAKPRKVQVQVTTGDASGAILADANSAN